MFKTFKWIIQSDGHGGATIQSRIIPHYVKYHELQLDSKLALDPSPFTWEMIKDGDGYRSVMYSDPAYWRIAEANTYSRFVVPGTNFALSLGAYARIRYLHEQPGTCIYLMDNSPRSRAAIQSGIVSYSTVLPKSQQPSSVYISEGQFTKSRTP